MARRLTPTLLGKLRISDSFPSKDFTRHCSWLYCRNYSNDRKSRTSVAGSHRVILGYGTFTHLNRLVVEQPNESVRRDQPLELQVWKVGMCSSTGLRLLDHALK